MNSKCQPISRGSLENWVSINLEKILATINDVENKGEGKQDKKSIVNLYLILRSIVVITGHH